MNLDPNATIVVEDIETVIAHAIADFKTVLGEDHRPVRTKFARTSFRAQILRYVEHPSLAAEDGHVAWMQARKAEGWTWGATYDAEAKTHPDLVPWDELVPCQRAKSELVRAIVAALAPLVRR
jgi:hypothetical protein